MTALAEKPFENYCTCGGYAWTMNGRPRSQPHMAWCPQAAEYAARRAEEAEALTEKDQDNG